ncbi:MAG: DUF2235 domain-containing protein [Magnetococcales bacterium]|nr:DUF2235 domain-containing protein [Magnetococcales bacterium]
MSKKIILCFDGTCNDPEDADQDRNLRGEVKDANITNILKLHLLLGGGLKNDAPPAIPNQQSFYFQGVGTYGGIFHRFIDMTIAPKKSDVRHIIHEARDTLKAVYQPGDQIYLFGFSRGAAIARRFAAIVGKEYIPELNKPNAIRFLGLFDTVASIGKPHLNLTEYPDDEVVFEDNKVSNVVEEALHMLSMDDRRILFFPTLMRADPRVTEVWFAGAHSDIGGGYYRDGLSDITLNFLIDELQRRGLGLQVRKPEEIDYDTADMQQVGLQLDDVAIDPNPLDKSHQQKLIEHRTVKVDGDARPLVHESAVQRIHGYVGYRPVALKNVAHCIVNGQCQVIGQASGLQDHVTAAEQAAKPLAVGESKEITVESPLLFNRGYVEVQSGETYRFTIDPTQKWQDGGIPCGPDGWRLSDPDVELGLKEIPIALSQPFRRNPDADWFEVVGVVGDEEGEKVRPLTAGDWKPQTSGELLLFANDLESFYGNNSGQIKVTIKRV